MENTTALRRIRLARGLSLRDVADQTGIPKSILHRIETGARITQREHARKLFRFYDCEIGLGQIYDPTFELEEMAG